ncbi:uncharacterized protein TRIADDRAFT_19406 [Trichoplax adhaerens]|uniref:BRO1 domain-containing protein n=1 Tax=Trichoplax adhaerens TaxID=10228 RepID=B3RJX9_TRIAD|nr:hypothetical protein TRIADDRAFT_19406 [Trichoplax adhaerens]EDV29140.1 hypothetical protein TRIADDRAFT_19406 [Trichoplax adhaerens]|eukprot:XP_002108342.1 hypothetical protein TRIADDRAFT_19406 [Trichoplax adhaerens]
MADQWFHRNPLKATSTLKFDNAKRVCKNNDAFKLFEKTNEERKNLLNILKNPQNDMKLIETSWQKYFALYLGFVFNAHKPGQDSPLRNLVPVHWTQSLTGRITVNTSDGIFELASMLINVAIWHMKRASCLAESGSLTMDDAKDIHKSLRIAAGLFQFVKENYAASLTSITGSCKDTEQQILEAYYTQCISEAEEVTVARAIELKHQASVVGGLSYETSKHFQAAATLLSSVNVNYAGKWKKYLVLKSVFYKACAYGCYSEVLLQKDKCGEAVKFGQEALQLYNSIESACREYLRFKGEGKAARVIDHQFFRKVGTMIKRNLDKANRENGFIYHHRVPAELPQLDLEAKYGIVQPESITMPPADEGWTEQIYASIDAHAYATTVLLISTIYNILRSSILT